jgi:hypothetical protein
MVESFTTLRGANNSSPKDCSVSILSCTDVGDHQKKHPTSNRSAHEKKWDKRNYETLNSSVKDVCQELQNKNFCQKLCKIQSNHKSLFNFTKLVKNKSRGVPALKADGVTLLTGPEKAEATASKFSAAHNYTISSPLDDIIEDGCSVFKNNEFNLEASILMCG